MESDTAGVSRWLGRVNFETGAVYLGGIKDYIPEIRRCRRLLLIGKYSKSSYSCLADRTVPVPVFSRK